MYNTCNNPIYLLHRYYYNHLLYRAKHPVKVHVWAGITRKVPLQSAYLMELWMQCYLQQSLTELYYHSWRAVSLINTILCKTMIQSTHLYRRAKQFFEDNGINWWKTPAEAPDLNPIENLWYEYIQVRGEAQDKMTVSRWHF